MALNMFALIILIAITAFAVYVFFSLGGLPGRIARQRNHPQADAIKVMGWLGLLTLGVVWAVAFVWAYITPKPLLQDVPSDEAEPTQANLKATA